MATEIGDTAVQINDSIDELRPPWQSSSRSNETSSICLITQYILSDARRRCQPLGQFNNLATFSNMGEEVPMTIQKSGDHFKGS